VGCASRRVRVVGAVRFLTGSCTKRVVEKAAAMEREKLVVGGSSCACVCVCVCVCEKVCVCV
jgi:hypothetical protein